MTVKVKDHKYLKALEFAFQHAEYTQKELCDAAGVTDPTECELLNESIGRYIDNSQTTLHPNNPNERKRYMSYAATLNYLEYIELHEARQSSKRALCVATIAIIISGLFALSSMVVNVLQWQQVLTPPESVLIRLPTSQPVSFIEKNKEYWVPCRDPGKTGARMQVLEIGDNSWVKVKGMEGNDPDCVIAQGQEGWWNINTGQQVRPQP